MKSYTQFINESKDELVSFKGNLIDSNPKLKKLINKLGLTLKKNQSGNMGYYGTLRGINSIMKNVDPDFIAWSSEGSKKDIKDIENVYRDFKTTYITPMTLNGYSKIGLFGYFYDYYGNCTIEIFENYKDLSTRVKEMDDHNKKYDSY